MRYLVCSGRVYLFIGQLEMQTAHSVVVVYRSQLAISLMCKRLRRAGKEEAFKCLTAENLFEICIYLFIFFCEWNKNLVSHLAVYRFNGFFRPFRDLVIGRKTKIGSNIWLGHQQQRGKELGELTF